VDPPRIFSLGIKTYKLLRYAKIRNINADYFGIATLMRKLGLHVDLIKVLTKAIIEHGVDVAIATWYPTALSVWLSNVSKPLYFIQDFHELV